MFPRVKYLLALCNGVCDVTPGVVDLCSVLGWIPQPHRGRLREKMVSKKPSPDFSLEVVCLKVMKLEEQSNSQS